jgi:hypothetical protein
MGEETRSSRWRANLNVTFSVGDKREIVFQCVPIRDEKAKVDGLAEERNRAFSPVDRV